MKDTPGYRGQPLVALMLVLGGWAALRVIAWEGGGIGGPLPAALGYAAESVTARTAAMRSPPKAPGDLPRAVAFVMKEKPSLASSGPARTDLPPPLTHLFAAALRAPLAPPLPRLRPVPLPQAMLSPASSPVSPRLSAAHQLLWMAALARLPLPANLLTPRPSVSIGPSSAGMQPFRQPRWSADGWLLLRRGGEAKTASGFAPATYGASQAGAVIRYRLVPTSPLRPAAYLRASAALNGSREREAALGLSARPIAAVPVVVAAEARVNDQPSGAHVRPAAFAYTELPPFALPLGTRGELYAQGGYVGGDFATAFVDGQLRADRRIARLGKGELRAGGGVWGGAQRGASRLDVGPTATMSMGLGGTAGARLGVDWRFRVAGNAAPASGPAMTLSAGF